MNVVILHGELSNFVPRSLMIGGSGVEGSLANGSIAIADTGVSSLRQRASEPDDGNFVFFFFSHAIEIQ